MFLLRALRPARASLRYNSSRLFSTSISQAMPKKRIVLCADGTWQSANNGSRAIPSNVAKISRALQCWDGDIPQIVYYDTGIGTNVVTSTSKENNTAKYGLEGIKEGATGVGLSENVCEAYNFVVNNWSKGDEIYVFGFSRGAYTARAIAGLLADVGVCNNAMMDQFWEMYLAYKAKKPWQGIRDTDWGKSTAVLSTYKETNGQYWLQKGNGKGWLSYCEKPDIQVVGVFDTVGALGVPENVVGNVHDNNTEYGFHNTDIHEAIKYAFHAVAIDERRRAFTPTLWYKPKENTNTTLIQCWFPGVHINIGGGSDDGLKELTKQVGDLEGMANVSFAWMVDRVREYTKLKFDDANLDIIVSRYMDSMGQVFQREIAANKASNATLFGKLTHFFDKDKKIPETTFRGWGVGPISDSFATSDLVTQFIGGSRVRIPGRYLFQENKQPNAPAVQKETFEYIHPVVAHAWSDKHPAGVIYKAKDENSFLARALLGFERVEKGTGQKGFKYVQKAKFDERKDRPWIDRKLSQGTDGKEWNSDNYPEWKGPVEIPEFQIPPDTDTFKSLERRLINSNPFSLIEKTWVGADNMSIIKDKDPKEYEHLKTTMTAQNERAKQSLQSWDVANGFA